MNAPVAAWQAEELIGLEARLEILEDALAGLAGLMAASSFAAPSAAELSPLIMLISRFAGGARMDLEGLLPHLGLPPDGANDET